MRQFSTFRHRGGLKWLLPCFLLFLAFAVPAPPPGGLDVAAPIGAYLNGNFPTELPDEDVIAEEIYTGLDWESPVIAIPFPFTSDLLVVEMDGRFFSIPDHDNATTRTLLMDIQDRSWYYDWSGTNTKHGGIQNAAFHPEFGMGTGKDYLYVYYVFKAVNESTNFGAPYYDRLSRFTWNGSQFDPASELIMINQYDTSKGHDGSGLAFGNDGFLYVSIGDEGTQNAAASAHTQFLNDRFRSGVWRLDVDEQGGAISHPIIRQPVNNAPAGSTPSYTQGYYIPNDNPWIDPTGGTLEEFYAIGLRQPFRMTYDKLTDNFWIGDVGSGQMEEVDVMDQPGLNFQWNYMEGTATGYRAAPSPLIGTERTPVHAYGRSMGSCIIGGYVYRGTDMPNLIGKYIFGDNGNGIIRSLEYSGGATNDGIEDLVSVGGSVFNGISSFGLKHDNELLVLKLGRGINGDGKIFRLKPSTPSTTPTVEIPETLSATGIFSDLQNLTPNAGIIPYSVNTPLWSAGTSKKRWVAIPNDGIVDSPGEQIGYSADGNWTFPAGTVFIKHFETPSGQKLETRVMVHGVGGEWYGHTYKWRANGTDADLLPEGGTDMITIEGETFEYAYPAVTECVTCHNENAGSVLGFQTRQLNRDSYYPVTGRTANQLETLSDLGFIPVVNTASVLTAVAIWNNEADLESRARSYLDANCSHCHQPGNNRAIFDARLSTALNDQHIVNGEVEDDLGVEGMEVVSPQQAAHSAMYVRMNTMDDGVSMPQLAKGRIDAEGVQLMENWINSLENACNVGSTITLGNPAVDGNFVDGHSPAVIINKTDSYENSSLDSEEICLQDFTFYARRIASPVTPFIAQEVGPNNFVILSIGETRDPGEYAVGANTFAFSDQGAQVIRLEPGEKIVTGFAYTYADGSPSTTLSVIPALNAAGQDAVWQTYYTSNGVYPGISIGKSPKLASGVATNLSRTYGFNITLGVGKWTDPGQGANLALQKPTSQSTTAHGGVSSRAVDGNTSGIWNDGSITHTTSQTNPWWRVDLGDNYILSSISVFNRTNCCTGRLTGAKVMVSEVDSNDPADYTEIGTLNSDAQQGFENLSAEGRYIMVYLEGTGKILSIAELQAFGELAPVLPNLALQKPATQSTTGWGGLASRAVDGNTSGIYNQGSITHTAVQTDPWWRVDLGAKYSLESISVFNRTDCCIGRMTGAKVMIGNVDSNDPTDFTEIATLGSDPEQDFENLSAEGQYIMVYLAGTGKILSIAELEAYGTEAVELSPAVVYDGCNFTGNSWNLEEGEYINTLSGDFGNDVISSIKVAEGYEVEVFYHFNYGGISQIFTEDEACLVGNPLDNNISGIKIRKVQVPATVYTDCNFGGTAWELEEGEYINTLFGDFTNDVISSIKVGAGYEVEVFQHFNYGGTNQTFTNDVACLVGNSLDNNISAIKIRKISAGASIQSLTASVVNQAVLLEWGLIGQLPQPAFSIERSVDGLLYEKIGLLDTNEPAQNGNGFSYTDEHVSHLSGLDLTYRVSTVDNQGRSQQSQSTTLAHDAFGHVLNLAAYPTPLDRVLTVEYSTTDSYGLSLQVYSQLGQVVVSQDLYNSDGRVQVETTDWPAGIYFVNLSDGIEGKTIKVVKTR